MALADKKIFKNPLKQQQEEDARIPVLTVFKNNAMIKNIFIILNNNEQTLLVGRHPHCNIVLTHPSVSRFHLNIRFNPSSRTLSLIDLSSVHGTWVCGRKLEPGVSVDLKEGDTFTVGVSTRRYRLRWVPSVPEFNAVVPQEEQEQVEEVRPDENLVEQDIPKDSFGCDEERKGQSKDENFGTETSYFATNSGGENKLCGCQNIVLSPPYVQSVDEVDNTQKIEACPEVEMPGDTNLFCTLREYLTHNICLPVVETVQATKLEQFQGLPSLEKHWSSLLTNIDPASFDEKGADSMAVIHKKSELGYNGKIGEDTLPTGARTYDSENSCLIAGKDIPDSKFHQIKVTEEVSVDSENQDKFCEEYKSELPDLNAKSCHEQVSLDEIEDIGNKCNDKIMDPASFGEKGVETVIPKEYELGCTLRDNDRIEDILATGARIFNSENTALLAEEANPVAAVTVIPKDYELGSTLRDNDRIEDILATEARIFNSENTSLLAEQANPVIEFQQIKTVEEVAVDSIPDGEKQNECDKESKSNLKAYQNAKSCDEVNSQAESLISSMPQEADLKITNQKGNQSPQSLIAVEECFEEEILVIHGEATEKAKCCHEQGHSPDEIVQDIGNKCTGSICPTSLQVESVNSSVPQESVLNTTNKVNNQTPQSLIAVTGCSEMEVLESHVEEATEKSSTIDDIWSRRGKAASAPQVQTRKSRFQSTSNVDTKVEMSNVKDDINKSKPKDLFYVLDEEEIFTPNKENLSPNTFHFQFMRKKGKLEEIKHSKSQRSHNLKENFSPNIYPAESISPISNKENQTPKVALEWKSQRKPLESHINLAHKQDTMELKKNTLERVPFQSLMNSGGNRKSGTSGPISAAKSIDDANNCGQISDKRTKPSHIGGEQKRNWDMVVDTASLLNKESRKALQLLQGLKGTRLIIPRLVIRELGNMKQQFRIFSRNSEASLALEWIEECMEKTEWWIHIQGSLEECRLIAPSPPAASPQTQFVGESCWVFPGLKSSKESASPTVEDNILDFALLYRRKESIGQVVLLSEDVTLKIKSMEKGLLCETVQRFHQSLVNPFSERFMWANSSPRGLTWTCHDDVVLKEKYCGLPAKAGLKLITEQFL
ncbi:SMAD/FHA domain superfamily [Sesbania bispinosa]|nr:SMAD/FHA domain superfamily [Sesbania bispinosa]